MLLIMPAEDVTPVLLIISAEDVCIINYICRGCMCY